jgi:hypothetical protein
VALLFSSRVHRDSGAFYRVEGKTSWFMTAVRLTMRRS